MYYICVTVNIFFYFKTISILFLNQQWWVGETGLVEFFRVGEMRVGEMGIGEMGQIRGEMGVIHLCMWLIIKNSWN